MIPVIKPRPVPGPVRPRPVPGPCRPRPQIIRSL